MDACISVEFEFETTITAVSPCETENITEIQIVGPFGLTLSPMAEVQGQSRYWYRNITWIPTNSGLFSICSKAISSNYLISKSNCFVLIVGRTMPKMNTNTISPKGLLPYNSLSQVLNFSCQFVTTMLKPTQSAFINVYSAINNFKILQIDSSYLNTTIIQDKTITFNIPIGNLSNGEYYITFDNG